MDQFGFLGGFLRAPSQSINLAELGASEVWAAVLSKARLIGRRTIDGRNVVSFEIRNAVDPGVEAPCRYEVDLAPEYGFFPIRWMKYTLAGECLQTFSVVDMAKASYNGVVYYYPKRAEGTHLGLHGELLVRRDWETSLFEIKPIEDNAVFSIDPASADEIVDQDAKKAFRVRPLPTRK
jgi:hypothetical protein